MGHAFLHLPQDIQEVVSTLTRIHATKAQKAQDSCALLLTTKNPPKTSVDPFIKL